jgi:hypothetical protein
MILGVVYFKIISKGVFLKNFIAEGREKRQRNSSVFLGLITIMVLLLKKYWNCKF